MKQYFIDVLRMSRKWTVSQVQEDYIQIILNNFYFAIKAHTNLFTVHVNMGKLRSDSTDMGFNLCIACSLIS